MTRLLVIAALLAAIAAGLQTWRLSRAEDRASAAEAKVTAYAEAAQIRALQDADLARLRKQAADLDDYLSTSTKGGGDAGLSPFLSDAAGQLWRK